VFIERDRKKEIKMTQALAKGYNPELYGNHAQYMLHFPGDIEFEIDRGLAKIIYLINYPFYLNGLNGITNMSCEHNLKGYAGISFNFDGFGMFIDLLDDKLMTGINFDDFDEGKIQNFLTEYIFNDMNENSHFDISIFYPGGEERLSKGIAWKFEREEIPKIEQMLEEAFQDIPGIQDHMPNTAAQLGSERIYQSRRFGRRRKRRSKVR